MLADPPSDVPSSQPIWEEILEWLPEDTETLIVAQGPFEFPADAPDEVTLDEAMRRFAAAVDVLQDGILGQELSGQKLLGAVAGSRRFTGPRVLGLMPYEGCHVLRFEPAGKDAVDKAFRTAQEKAEKSIEIAGLPVAVFTRQYEDDLWSLYLCRPRPDVVMCATHQGFLEETLNRIGRKPARRALPADLPEWKHVATKARVWAVRHYRKESADEDPSSPLRPPAPWNVSDSAAIGFVFWYSPGRNQIARARYLTRAKNAVELATEGWHHPTEGLTPQITQAAPGVVEIKETVSDQETAGSFLFVLFGYLGHGIYL